MNKFWEEMRAIFDRRPSLYTKIHNILQCRRAVESIEKYGEARNSDPLFEKTMREQAGWYESGLEKSVGKKLADDLIGKIDKEAKRQVHEEGYNWFDTWDY